MTRITLPGQSNFSGIAEWGRVDAEEMIRRDLSVFTKGVDVEGGKINPES